MKTESEFNAEMNAKLDLEYRVEHAKYLAKDLGYGLAAELSGHGAIDEDDYPGFISEHRERIEEEFGVNTTGQRFFDAHEAGFIEYVRQI